MAALLTSFRVSWIVPIYQISGHCWLSIVAHCNKPFLFCHIKLGPADTTLLTGRHCNHCTIFDNENSISVSLEQKTDDSKGQKASKAIVAACI